MRPKLLIVEGPCAAGKSSAIQAAISRLPSVAFVDIDLVKDRTFRIESVEQWDEVSSLLGDDWRRRVATAVGLSWCKSLAGIERPTIVELCDTMQLYDALIKIFAERNYEINRVFLVPSLEECLERNSSRPESLRFFDSKVMSSFDFYIEKLAEIEGAQALANSDTLTEEISRLFSSSVA